MKTAMVAGLCGFILVATSLHGSDAARSRHHQPRARYIRFDAEVLTTSEFNSQGDAPKQSTPGHITSYWRIGNHPIVRSKILREKRMVAMPLRERVQQPAASRIFGSRVQGEATISGFHCWVIRSFCVLNDETYELWEWEPMDKSVAPFDVLKTEDYVVAGNSRQLVSRRTLYNFRHRPVQMIPRLPRDNRLPRMAADERLPRMAADELSDEELPYGEEPPNKPSGVVTRGKDGRMTIHVSQ